MNIIHTWKESFALFVPKNLKLFLLVTLKSIIDTYTILLKYWWFLYVGLFFMYTPLFKKLVDMWINVVGGRTISFKIIAGEIILFHILILLVTFLAARPSTWLKNYAYFLRYLASFWYLIIFVFLFYMVGINKIPMMLLLFMLYILFLFDSDGSIINIGWSFVRAIKMLIYNLPLFVIIEILLQGFSRGFLFLQLDFLLYMILMVIMLPIFVCLITNIYVKKLHDQSELYFPTPK